MRTQAAIAFLLVPANAFTPTTPPTVSRIWISSSSVHDDDVKARQDLEEFATLMNPRINYFDPLKLAEMEVTTYMGANGLFTFQFTHQQSF